jgi:hypothetical protein
MAAAGRFGSSSDIDIGTILADKDCKRTNNSNQANNMMMPQFKDFFMGNSAFTPYITECVVNFNVFNERSKQLLKPIVSNYLKLFCQSLIFVF